jgi:phage terminase large subunit-like protein
MRGRAMAETEDNPRLQAIAAYRRLLEAAIDKGIEAEVERELCKSDLFYLLTVVLGRKDLNHDWLFARCREVQAEPNGYLDLWPREHYKSTIITFGLTIQDILNNPEITVGIFSFTRPIAKAFLRQIMRELETNERLKTLFPDILWQNPKRDAPKWSEDDGIIVRRKSNPKESTVEAWGVVDGQPTSKHFGTMSYDDLVTRDSVTNPEMVEKVTEAWASSRALGTEGGATRYSGTRWAYLDTYRIMIERGAVKERRYTVTEDGTVEGVPVLRSREWIAEKRREMGPFVFSAQMLLDPAADRTQGFQESWLRYYPNSRSGDFEGLNKYLLIDPANDKKKKSDFTAMAVIGLGPDENYYLLDAIRDRLNLRERADAVFSLHRRWKPRVVGYEKYGMQADIDYLKERMGQENYRFEITEIGGQMSKIDRIRRMIPIFAPVDEERKGRFLLPESLMKTDYEGIRRDLIQSFILEEYNPFPVGLHDDLFDAISRIWDIPTVWPKPHQAEDRYARPRRQRRTASAWAA